MKGYLLMKGLGLENRQLGQGRKKAAVTGCTRSKALRLNEFRKEWLITTRNM